MISIVIPAYNRSHTLPRTLDSVSKQVYNNWECLVVDDGSTDNTKDVVLGYSSRDKRFSLLTNTRSKGAQGARNEGILHAKGDWILLFDSDDALSPTYLEIVVSKISTPKSIIVCYGKMIDEKTGDTIELLNRVQDGKIHKALLTGTNYVPFDSALINRDCLLNIGLLDEKCPSHQELETHLRLSKLYDYCVVPIVLWSYFVGRDDTISMNRTKHIAGLLYITKKHLWEYRLYAYHSFAKRMRNLWNYAGLIPERKCYFRKLILLIAPELPLILIHNKLKCLIK